MKRGTIILAKFPFTDLTSAKRRPGIVVSANINHTDDVIIAFISSVIPSEIGSMDYLITEDHKDFTTTGLKKNSVIKLNKLATVNLSVITGEIGTVSESTMQQVNKCLAKALGL